VPGAYIGKRVQEETGRKEKIGLLGNVYGDKLKGGSTTTCYSRSYLPFLEGGDREGKGLGDSY